MTDQANGWFELPTDRIECRVAVPCLLTEAAGAAGVMLNVACGGKGACSGCEVELIAGAFADLSGERIDPNGGPRRALACQTRLIAGGFHVRVPRSSMVEAEGKFVVEVAHVPEVELRPAVRKRHLELSAPTLADQRADLERIIDALADAGMAGAVTASRRMTARAGRLARWEYKLTATVAADGNGWRLIRLQGGDASGIHYGAAVDVGTTTVVVALVDLNTGKILDTASSYNQQITRCDNVASRISYCTGPEAVEELCDLIIENVNRLLGVLLDRHRLKAADVAHMTVAGNTVMTHLFCGLDPTPLGGVPFAPVTNFPGPYRAAELKLAINPEAPVDLFPSAAAYVGGDVTADAFVCGLRTRPGLNVLVDIGTNAETVVGKAGRFVACAAPAGPAFEGHGLSCGMRAAAGAIDTVRIDSLDAPPALTVIGDARPAGVCGSGLIDFIGQAFLARVIGASGRFTQTALARCPQIRRVANGKGELPAYELVTAEASEGGLGAIGITEKDIATVLQAKGVIFSAVQIALKTVGAAFDDVDRFYLAGGFARHIDLDNAVAMGLLPDIDREKFVFIGNGSLGGAMLALVDSAVRADLPHLAAAPEVIELNLDPDFMDAYTLGMFVPNGDPSLFPSVRQKT
ncbi:MAG TPA: ASKHA domain-containing protein [Phycisphaerae bacterium]|nr:ASKHA domain-containing protein [Phycisphaerae bacterium]